MTYQMKLQDKPYMCIKNETKTVELRLNDEKRQLLKTNDMIEFTNLLTNDKMLVRIEELSYYSTFDELYKDFDKVSMGYENEDEANPSDMEKYYSKEEQNRYGVVAIKIKKL